MNRYLVFSGSAYYPNGGWEDYDGSFDTVAAAQANVAAAGATGEGPSWAHIVDLTTGDIVASWSQDGGWHRA
jgi:hypothetical protein